MDIKKKLLEFQREEITEYHFYMILSRRIKGENKNVLERIAREEKNHYEILKRHTGEDVEPDKAKLLKYSILQRVFGLTFAIKLMEKGEKGAQEGYSLISDKIPEIKKVIEEEEEHEKLLINLIDEEKLEYVGSMVLGLNDALVELTGTLAGLTLALRNTRLIGIAGLITGFAASLSMAASEFLSRKSEGGEKNPIKASIYTGVSYIITVILLILPYVLFKSYLVALLFTILIGVFIVFVFTFFVSVVKELDFKKRFFEMAGISLSVSLVSFLVGWVLRVFFNL
ncbi:MAG: rubrerythrin family protein [Caldiserica bacterium]|nr:MAG: rubrerythrin family protein [Caldisericota bacterium]